jgi:ABC-type glycerol-3-phosphate transport system substrate-binding protein
MISRPFPGSCPSRTSNRDSSPSIPFYHYPFVEGNGGIYVGPDGHAVGFLNGSKVLGTEGFLLDLFQQGYALTPGIFASMGGSALPLLLSGRLAMELNQRVWILDTAKAQEIVVDKTLGVVPPPRLRSTTLGIHSLAVGSNAADKNRSALLALYVGGAGEVVDA